MSRILLCLLVVLVTLIAAEHRLSDGAPKRVGDRIPPLWEQAEHGAAPYARPASNCVLMVSIDRDSPYTLTPVERGVPFDIDADGALERVSWTEAGSDVAFLALDGDKDGKITSGKELIGPHTLPGVRNGPHALTMLASPALAVARRSVVDEANPLFFTLLLWTDDNHNGISEPRELRQASDAVSAIGLGFERHHRRDRHGNESRNRGFVHLATGRVLNAVLTAEEDIERRRPMYDACLAAEG